MVTINRAQIDQRNKMVFSSFIGDGGVVKDNLNKLSYCICILLSLSPLSPLGLGNVK